MAKYNIARAKYSLTQYTESIEDLDEVIRIATKLNDNVLLYKSYSLKGNNLFDQNEHNKSLDQYIRARGYAKLTKNPIYLSRIALNVALIKKIHKDYKEAIDILSENLEILKKIEKIDKKNLANERTILMQLADIYLRIEQPEKAQYYNNLAFKISPKKEFPNAYYWAMLNKGIIEYQNKNYKQSIDICKQVETYYISTNELSNLATPYFYIGKNSYKLQEFHQAVEYLSLIHI